ncbi:MAG: NACHT domain-containing protein [Verrucomicrobia bacterium]|nr:NACHT domain-containing protein [Verrucomicrobiota bacterium]
MASTVQSIRFGLNGQTNKNNNYHLEITPGSELKKIHAKVLSAGTKSDMEVHPHRFKEPLTLEKAGKIFLLKLPHIEAEEKKDKNSPYLSLTLHKTRKGNPLNVDLIIEGQVKDKHYKLEINPHDLRSSKAYIKNGDYQPVTCSFDELKKLSPEDLNRLLPSLKSDLGVDLNNQGHLVVSLKGKAKADIVARQQLPVVAVPAVPAAVSPPPKPLLEPIASVAPAAAPPPDPLASRVSILSVHSSKDLAEALGQPNPSPIALSLVHHEANVYAEKHQPSEEMIQEATTVLGKMKFHDGFRTLNALLTNCDATALLDERILDGVIKILVKLQQSLFQKMLAKQSKSDFRISDIDPAQLVRILPILTGHLEQTHQQKDNANLARKQLEAMIALLDVMTAKKLKNLDHNLIRAAYIAIKKFEDHPDLHVHYLVNYAKQSFAILPSDQSTTKAVLNRGFLVVKGLARIADAIEIEKPWKMAFHLPQAIIEAAPDFKEAFSNIQQLKKDWFLHLSSIRSYLMKTPAFYNFLKALVTDPNSVRGEEGEEMDFHNTSLVKGFVDLLWDVLHQPADEVRSEETQLFAIALLDKIYMNNIQPGTKESFSIENDAKKGQLRELILLYLKSATAHPRDKVSQHAKEALARLMAAGKVQSKDLPPSISFVSVENPNELFIEAARMHPLFLTLQQIRDKFLGAKNLKGDEQLAHERPYYISLDVKNEKTGKVGDFKTEFNNFLDEKNKNPLMTIEGHGGAGKSLALKICVAELFENFNDENDYFPIFLPLSSVKDPTKAWHKILEDNGIDAAKQIELRRRKVLVVFDAFDEIKFKDEEAQKVDIYMSNGLAEWENLKCIVSFKKGTAKASQFSSLSGEPVSLSFEEFDDNRINQYLDRYLTLHENDKDHPLAWPKERYKETFTALQKSNIWSRFKNPLRLKIGVDGVPAIVEQFQKANPGKPLKDLFQGETTKAIDWRLFKAFACISACRSQVKIKRAGGNILAARFIEEPAKLAREMFEVDGKKEYITDEETKLDPWKKYFPVPPAVLIYKEYLIYRPEGWSFIHNDYRVNFTTLGQRAQDLERFKADLSSEFYQTFVDRFSKTT